MKILFSEFRLYLCNNIFSNIPSHTIRLWYYRKVMKFTIGKNTHVFMHCRFDCTKNFIIGSNSVINSFCRIDNRGGVKIGDNVSISQECILLTADHDPHSANFEGRSKPIIIMDYVWLGTRSLILPGVSLGYGAMIAASATVTNNVLERTIVGGVPARQIGERKCEFDYTTIYKRFFQ